MVRPEKFLSDFGSSSISFAAKSVICLCMERMAFGVVVELAQSRRQILPFGVELWDVILLLAQIIERDFVGQQRHVVGVFDPFVDG